MVTAFDKALVLRLREVSLVLKFSNVPLGFSKRSGFFLNLFKLLSQGFEPGVQRGHPRQLCREIVTLKGSAFAAASCQGGSGLQPGVILLELFLELEIIVDLLLGSLDDYTFRRVSEGVII